MTVGELLGKLNKLEPELDVLCFSEHKGELLVLKVEDVSANDAEQVPGSHTGKPGLKFGKSIASLRLALIRVTTDF